MTTSVSIVQTNLYEGEPVMSLQNATSAACHECTEELESSLIEQNCLGGRLQLLFGCHVLAFPEGEYALRTRHLREKEHCELIVTASIRATPPSLDTWKADWTARVDTHLDVSRLVTAEIMHARQRFVAMLRDHGEPVLP